MKTDPSLQFQIPALQVSNLMNAEVAIVGGTGGIGRALAKEFAKHGARVLVIGQTLRDADTPGIRFLPADLSLMSEARRVAALIPAETLSYLIFTTGIFAAPTRQETSEGIERDLAVSYLNRLVMLKTLAPKLGQGRLSRRKPRVFVMGYPGSGQCGSYDDLNCERSYKAMAAHITTVAANEMLVLDGVQRWPNANFYGLNPGLIKTNIRNNLLGAGTLKSRFLEGLIGILSPSAEEYAKRMVPLMCATHLDGHSGAMFNRKGKAILPSNGLTQEHVRNFTLAAEALAAKATAHVQRLPAMKA